MSSSSLGLHAMHPAMSVTTPLKRHFITTDDERELTRLQEQISSRVLQHKCDQEAIAKLNAENARQLRRIQVLEAVLKGQRVAVDQHPNPSEDEPTLPPSTVMHAEAQSADSVLAAPAPLVPAPPTPGGPAWLVTTQNKPGRRCFSALSTTKERSDAVEPLLVERTKDLQAALHDMSAASEAMHQHWQRDIQVYEQQLRVLKEELAAQRTVNDSLVTRLAEGVLDNRKAINMFNVLAKLKAQRRTREASLMRLESLERSAMMAHDDHAFVRRWQGRDFPTENVTLVFIDFLGFSDLCSKLGHIRDLVMSLYRKAVAQVARKWSGIFSHGASDATMLYVFTNTIDALLFAKEATYALLDAEWPDALLHDPNFSVVADPTSPGRHVIFAGPRARFGVWFGNCAAEFDAASGTRSCIGNEVIAAGRLAALSRPGEICMSPACRDRLDAQLAGIQEAASPFGDLASWTGAVVGVKGAVPAVSLVPPDLCVARRAYWKRELGSMTALRSLCDWTAKYDNPAGWAKWFRSRHQFAIERPQQADSPRLRSQSITTAAHQTVAAHASSMSVSAASVTPGTLASVRAGLPSVQLRAMYCAALRALERREHDAMERLDTLATPSSQAPTGNIVLLTGCISKFAEIMKRDAAIAADVEALVFGEAKQLVARHRGYWVKSERGIFSAGFSTLKDAIAVSAAIHTNLLPMVWPPLVTEMFPTQIVAVPSHPAAADQQPAQPQRKKIFGGVVVAVGICRANPRVHRDVTTGRVEYQGVDVVRCALICAAARPGETLLSEASNREVRSSPYATEYSLAGQGSKMFLALNRPEDVTSILPVALGARFRVWNATAATAPGSPVAAAAGQSPPTAPSNAATAAVDATSAAVTAAIELQFRKFVSKRGAQLSTAGQSSASPTAATPSWAPSDVHRIANLVPKLSLARRRLLHKNQAIEKATMCKLDDQTYIGSVPHVGHAAIAIFDLEGSEKLFKAFGELFVAAQRHYNSLVLQHAHDHDGYRIKHNGFDSFAYAFADSVTAMKFCLSLQLALNTTDWPSDLLKNELSLRVKDVLSGSTVYNGLRCRMGIASGVVATIHDEHTRRTDYTGIVMMAAARASRSCRGGDIAVTAETLSEVCDNENTASAGFVVAVKRDPKSAYSVVYPTAVAGRVKGLLLKQSGASNKQGKDDDGQKSGNQWWRSAQACVASVLSSRYASKAAQPPPASVAIQGVSATPAAAVAALAQPATARVSPRGPAVGQNNSRRKSTLKSPGLSASVNANNNMSMSFPLPALAASTTAAPYEGLVPVELLGSSGAKIIDLTRTLATRVDAVQQAVNGVPSFSVSYKKVVAEVDKIILATSLVVKAVNSTTVGSTALPVAMESVRQMSQSTVDVLDDAPNALQREQLSKSRRAVCLRCGLTFRHARYCGATGLLHVPRSSFYVYNLSSNVPALDEIRLLVDQFDALDTGGFGQLTLDDVQSLAALYGELVDSATFHTKLCKNGSGAVTLLELLQYLYPSAKVGLLEDLVREATTRTPTPPDSASESDEASSQQTGAPDDDATAADMPKAGELSADWRFPID